MTRTHLVFLGAVALALLTLGVLPLMLITLSGVAGLAWQALTAARPGVRTVVQAAVVLALGLTGVVYAVRGAAR
ncbi:hypothetical protein [Streptomyces sp. NRRL F-5630]|uniref:hypothetical protein n=1 Tax=Streptomyces sp. NRRL F-5630 TaxID=1463864 RepID=UPI003EBBF80D